LSVGWRRERKRRVGNIVEVGTKWEERMTNKFTWKLRNLRLDGMAT